MKNSIGIADNVLSDITSNYIPEIICIREVLL